MKKLFPFFFFSASLRLSSANSRFTGVDLGDFDKAAFIRDLQQIVEAGSGLIGDIPYHRYVFLAIGNGRGGIEHANSCSLSFNGKDLQTEDGRQRMLSFIAMNIFTAIV